MEQVQRPPEIVEARKSVERVQLFDPETLTRADDLGVLNFQAAVAPARRLINLVRLIALDALDDLPVSAANAVRTHVDGIYNIFGQVLQFDLGQQQNPKTTRDQIVNSLRNQYEPLFGNLQPIIAFSARKTSDLERLELEARGTIQKLNDRIAELEADMTKRANEAEETLKTIRSVAAEQGVSQQAIYFKSEAEAHEKAAEEWLKYTVVLAAGLLAYAFLSFGIHRISWLAPTSLYETTQLAVSKALVFVTIAFGLILAARNFTAHRHNAVVNKHRQNGLVTYSALVKAASAGVNSDIVLTKAAGCIFDAQPTGFAKSDGADAGGMSMINVAPSLKVPTAG